MALTAWSNEDGRNKASVDRISHLPPDLMERILECLPLKDAVRMSILSTYWRYKWALLPQLIVDPYFFSTVLKYRPPCEAPYFDDCCDDDCDCCDDACYLCEDACEISEDMFARSKLVDDMLLCHGGPIRLYHSPRAEHLPWASSDEESAILGFSRLVSLQVYLFFMTDGEANEIEILVSKCPLLESFYLDLHEGKSCLSIHAPKLQNLVLAGWLSSICLEETSKIKTLSLKIPLHQHQKRDTIVDFFTRLPNVEKLVLDHYFWLTDWLNEIGPPQKVKLPGQLKQLRDLTFDRVTFINQVTISFIYCFVKMAPKLQKFYIHLSTYAAQPSTNDMIVDEDCCLYYLRSAKFCRYCGTLSPTLRLIKLILASSPILEVMLTEAIEEDEDKVNIVELLQYYPCASADTEIIFKA